MELKQNGMKVGSEDRLTHEKAKYRLASLRKRGYGLICPVKMTYAPLHEAIGLGDIEAVRRSVNGAKRDQLNSVDSCGMTALHYAAKHACKDIAMFLLDNGASVNLKTKQGCALQTALR